MPKDISKAPSWEDERSCDQFSNWWKLEGGEFVPTVNEYAAAYQDRAPESWMPKVSPIMYIGDRAIASPYCVRS